MSLDPNKVYIQAAEQPAHANSSLQMQEVEPQFVDFEALATSHVQAPEQPNVWLLKPPNGFLQLQPVRRTTRKVMTIGGPTMGRAIAALLVGEGRKIAQESVNMVEPKKRADLLGVTTSVSAAVGDCAPPNKPYYRRNKW